MELLKPLFSVSLLGIIIYAIGVILVEGGANLKQLVVPRTRKQRYKLNSLSFSEFVFGLFLIAGVLYVYKAVDNPITIPALWAVCGGLIIKFLLLVFDTEKLRKSILDSRMGTKVSIILLMVWGSVSILLLSQANSESERLLAYLISAYLLLLTLFAKARIAHRFASIAVDITLKDGSSMNNRELLDETNDFLVLGDGELSNLLISKDQVSVYKVNIADLPAEPATENDS